MPCKLGKQRKRMHANKPKMAKKLEQYVKGGPISGKTHKQGGVSIEAEGGEFIVKKDAVNEETLPVLDYVNEYGKLPIIDSRKRRT